MLSILEQHYGPENVTVTVEWAQKGNTTYDVSILPMAPIASINGITSRQVTISYNTEYNLSVHVVAVTPCGSATVSTALNYGESLITLL